ncbi:MAG TPA: uracil-DNA glycosylase [Dehalococcoidales bacterium]|nr:uracil-DNA glycosylase [Dehalococcoidales bacterium]
MSDLTELYRDVAVCRRCDLYKTATNPVPGEGPENAQIMFIGEGPGWNEDQLGRPFVGAAGKFLDQMFALIGLRRSDVYIANVVKHRPPNNRDPLPDEISACSHFLDRQIAITKPKIIVTLGRHSMARYFPNSAISKIHGTYFKKDGVVYFAMYHPAAALHQANLKYEIEQDMLKLPVILNELQAVPKPDPVENPTQLKMF